MAALLRIEKVRWDRKDGIGKVIGTACCVAGATVIYGPTPPPLHSPITQTESMFVSLGDASGKSWTLGCIYLIGHCLSWSVWLVLQAPKEPTLSDPTTSSSDSLLLCKGSSCSYCSKSQQCGYATTYEDDSVVSGYYDKETLSFNVVLEGIYVAVNSSTPYIFACSTVCTGDFASQGIDGILGFGQGPHSFVSQISAAGLAPPIFSHCLKGEGSGCTLVFGDVEEPPLDYTPLVASESLYIMNLQSVSANGQELKISPEHQGAIVDIGTTYGSLVEEAFYFLVNVINAAVSGAATATTFNGRACYYIVNSTINIFPEVSLTFAGWALKMVFKPDEYLRIAGINGNPEIWCIIFHPSSKTVLGDFFNSKKIIAYDLLRKRIGLKSYNC